MVISEKGSIVPFDLVFFQELYKSYQISVSTFIIDGAAVVFVKFDVGDTVEFEGFGLGHGFAHINNNQIYRDFLFLDHSV